MPIFTSRIEFSKSFAFTARIIFAPDSLFSALLDSTLGYFTDTQVIFANLAFNSNVPTTTFVGNYIPPKIGIIYFSNDNLISTTTGFYITPKTGTISKILLNATTAISANRVYSYLATLSTTLTTVASSIPVTFFYGIASFSSTLDENIAAFDAKLLFFTGPFSNSLDSISSAITGKFYYFSGTFSSIFINTASNILAGVARMATFAPTLSDATTSVVLKTPIRIFVTIAIITNYVLRNVLTGAVWPVGSLTATLTTFTSFVNGVLPIPISGTLSTNTMALQNPPFFRVFNVPAGNLTRNLTDTIVAISGKVPIRIYVTFVPVLSTILTSFRSRVFIGGNFTKILLSVALGWFLRSEFPRQGVLSTYLPITSLIYAKTSNHGSFVTTLTNIFSTIYLKTPIRIFIDFTTTLKLATSIFRGKSTIGGVLTLNTASFSPMLRVLVVISGIITFSTIGVSFSLNLKVPIPISGVLATSLPLAFTSYITGKGHYRPILNSTLASISVSFPMRFLGVRGVLALTNFTGPIFSSRPSYDGFIGELYPYRSGKFWKLLIYSNNGDPSSTSFSKIGLFSLQADGTVIDVLDGVPEAENYSASNAEYTQPGGMFWSYALPTTTEIRYYTIKGV